MLAVYAEVEGERANFSLPTCVNNAHKIKQMEPLDRKVLSSCFFPSLCDVPTSPFPFGYISPSGCGSLEELLTEMGWIRIPQLRYDLLNKQLV